MIQALAGFIPVVALLVSMLPVAIVRYWLIRQRKKNIRYSPLGTDLLRPPGHSLALKIKELDDDILVWLCVLLTTPILLTAIYLSQLHFGDVANWKLLMFAFCIGGAAAYAFFANRLWKLLYRRSRYVLGHEGELATAQCLDLLMLKGCRVFHDVPSDCGNNDHVVISRSGVFSINSKGFSKPQKTKNVATVDYVARTLTLTQKSYPLSTITKPVETEANWLGKFLSQAVGETISVEPLIALPGWQVKLVGKKYEDTCVFSPRNSGGYFLQSGPDKLSPTLITRIAHQMDQICRNVEAETKIKHELSND